MPFINGMAWVIALASALFIILWFLPDPPEVERLLARGAKIQYHRLFIAIGLLITAIVWIVTMT